VKVLVTGATGYIGREVAAAVAEAGHETVGLARPGSESSVPAGVTPVSGDVTDLASLKAAVQGVDAIINLVAILNGSDAEFEAVNAGGPRNVVAAAESAGVRRLLHMSAAGVTERNAPRTRYWRTKLAGKQAVMESALDWTVFEPSFVFGKGGGALKTFEGLLRAPVVAVIGDGRYRHQPVWIGDVARSYVVALERPETIGKRYELGGPQVFEFNDLLDDLARITGRPPRRKIHVPVGLMKAQARVLSHFPPPLKVTREQIEMLIEGTECDLTGMREDLRIEPASLVEAYTK
jgi:NADH dehydrogenase